MKHKPSALSITPKIEFNTELTELQVTETSDKQWIFGLSIDEECSWLAVKLEQSGKLGQESLFGSFAKLTEDFSQPADLEEYLIENLQLVKKENPQIFRGCLAFGISSIGVSDDDTKTLKNIDRKKWKRNRDGVLVNFQKVSDQLFKPKPQNISVSNDTSAKAVAEYIFRNDKSIDLMYKNSNHLTLAAS